MYVIFSVFLVIMPLYSSPTETGISHYSTLSVLLYLLQLVAETARDKLMLYVLQFVTCLSVRAATSSHLIHY